MTAQAIFILEAMRSKSQNPKQNSFVVLILKNLGKSVSFQIYYSTCDSSLGKAILKNNNKLKKR
jgi:hypothetical protein